MNYINKIAGFQFSLTESIFIYGALFLFLVTIIFVPGMLIIYSASQRKKQGKSSKTRIFAALILTIGSIAIFSFWSNLSRVERLVKYSGTYYSLSKSAKLNSMYIDIGGDQVLTTRYTLPSGQKIIVTQQPKQITDAKLVDTFDDYYDSSSIRRITGYSGTVLYSKYGTEHELKAGPALLISKDQNIVILSISEDTPSDLALPVLINAYQDLHEEGTDELLIPLFTKLRHYSE